VRVVKQWNGLPRDVVRAPSLETCYSILWLSDGWEQPQATFTIGVQRDFLHGSNALILHKLEKTGERMRRELQIQRTSLSRKLLQKEGAGEVASFFLFLDTTRNALQGVNIAREQREMHTSLEGNDLSKYMCKGKDILGLQLSCLEWSFLVGFFWQQGEMDDSFALCHFCKASLCLRHAGEGR